ncbi:Protein halfway [Amphibalanus amphitrite]|uniref:Protein halfway n=1 Tax=Amphibalanus amphitrite TaxID=1232801 RepID=A0A6A4WG80_AMPAM|nr:Protein halfway [Amphibalanus amphitrite]
MLLNFEIFVVWAVHALSSSWVSATSETSDAGLNSSTLCPSTSSCTCQSSIIQCSGLSSLDLLPPSSVAEQLVVLDSQLPLLNVTLLQHLPQLRHLELTNCSIGGIVGTWWNPHLQDINLASNNFTTFSLNSLDGLLGLRTLNLSANPLRSVLPHPPVEARLQTLDLTSRHWNCTEHTMTWLAAWLQRSPPRLLAGESETLCEETRKQYRTMDGRRLVDVLRLTQTMLDQCPSAPPFGCSCDLIQVDVAPTPAASPASAESGTGGEGPLIAVIVEVYCDNRGLTEFPPLTDFGPVIGNHSGYQALTALFLDGNLLEAEDANRLEGSDFIHRFSILSLSRNKLQTLPLYAFDNAFQKRSFNVDSLFLGGNPWLCDCDSAFTFSFRTWLASQHKLIRDRAEIRCGAGALSTGPPAGPPLLTLSRRKLCGGPQISWWDVAIGLLATAVIVLMLKFAYDVTVYRRTGELPLVVRKLPW